MRKSFEAQTAAQQERPPRIRPLRSMPRKHAKSPCGGGQGGGGGGGGVKAKSFYGSVDVSPTTAKVSLVTLADEIIAVLSSDPNATVKITVEIDADFPDGASDQIKRAVSEKRVTSLVQKQDVGVVPGPSN